MTAGQADHGSIAGFLDGLTDCLPLAGTDGFVDPFLDCVEKIGARQCMVFSYSEASASCLLARNFTSRTVGRRLADRYLSGWFLKDPLFRDVLQLADGACEVRTLADTIAKMDSEYRRIFFDEPRLADKTAVLVRRGRKRMILNFYSGKDTPVLADSGPSGAALLRLCGQMVADHFCRLTEPDYPLPLAVLSERERAVCLAMLAGRKAEAIAADLGIATSSVVTYRKRAYQKLGISSRGELFGLCV